MRDALEPAGVEVDLVRAGRRARVRRPRTKPLHGRRRVMTAADPTRRQHLRSPVRRDLPVVRRLPVPDHASSASGIRPPDLPAADSVAWRLDDRARPGRRLRFAGELWAELPRHAWRADRGGAPVRRSAAGGQRRRTPACVPVARRRWSPTPDRLPALRALFLGDMASEECEISWIQQATSRPLLEAFPALEEFARAAAAGTETSLPAACATRRCGCCGSSPAGCRPRSCARSASATCPRWSTWSCGWAPTTTAATPPSRTWRRSCSGAPLARAAPSRPARRRDRGRDRRRPGRRAPVVARLETLDLSMGMLTDVGAAALLAGQPLTHLRSSTCTTTSSPSAMMRPAARGAGAGRRRGRPRSRRRPRTDEDDGRDVPVRRESRSRPR